VQVYFDYTLRAGVASCLVAFVVAGHWMMLLWAVVMLGLFWVQRDAPERFPSDDGRGLFLASAVTQCSLSIVLAIVSGATGATLLAIGMSMNIAVIAANGGRMPIACAEPQNDCYTEASEYTRLMWLCDHFQTTETTRAKWLISPGDALECIGIWVLAAEVFLAS
jgi:hypothetical protein